MADLFNGIGCYGASHMKSVFANQVKVHCGKGSSSRT